MIRLSKLADYSFIILIQMVSDNLSAASAADLAEKTTLPLPTVSKILKLLSKSNIVTSQRGASGGYHLTAVAEKITVAQIVEAVDGPIALMGCISHGHDPSCIARSVCPMRAGWDKINTALRSSFNSVTLADLLGSPFPSAEKGGNS